MVAISEDGWLNSNRTDVVEINKVPDKFDPYREALIMELETVWPEEYDHLDADEKSRLEEKLHADAENASQIEYFRVHTGFCRKIIVSADDLARVEA